MATDPQSAHAHRQAEDVPEVLDADEHGTITLAIRDDRVSDDDAFEMPSD